MRPSEKVMETGAKIFGRQNAENLFEDFMIDLGKAQISQDALDQSFLIFMAGATVPMSPESNFNKKYAIRVERFVDGSSAKVLEKCCEDPDIVGRESYTSGDFNSGIKYCKNCGTGWSFNKESQKYERSTKTVDNG